MSQITEPFTKEQIADLARWATPTREHAVELITAQADAGLRNLRAQLESAKNRSDTREVIYLERRINERQRFLNRITTGYQR